MFRNEFMIRRLLVLRIYKCSTYRLPPIIKGRLHGYGLSVSTGQLFPEINLFYIDFKQKRRLNHISELQPDHLKVDASTLEDGSSCDERIWYLS